MQFVAKVRAALSGVVDCRQGEKEGNDKNDHSDIAVIPSGVSHFEDPGTGD